MIFRYSSDKGLFILMIMKFRYEVRKIGDENGYYRDLNIEIFKDMKNWVGN